MVFSHSPLEGTCRCAYRPSREATRCQVATVTPRPRLASGSSRERTLQGGITCQELKETFSPQSDKTIMMDGGGRGGVGIFSQNG